MIGGKPRSQDSCYSGSNTAVPREDSGLGRIADRNQLRERLRMVQHDEIEGMALSTKVQEHENVGRTSRI